jgi:hypothetical protein
MAHHDEDVTQRPYDAALDRSDAAAAAEADRGTAPENEEHATEAAGAGAGALAGAGVGAVVGGPRITRSSARKRCWRDDAGVRHCHWR